MKYKGITRSSEEETSEIRTKRDVDLTRTMSRHGPSGRNKCRIQGTLGVLLQRYRYVWVKSWR